MLEGSETSKELARRDYDALVSGLRVALVNAQDDLRRADFPVLLVLDGDDRQGCLDVLAAMREWMDTRYLRIHVCGRPGGEAQRRPWLWRFWRRLPAVGEFAVFHEAWPVQAIAAAALDEIDAAEFERRLERIERFEETLAAEGTLLIKLWIHQPLEVLRARRAARARRVRDGHPWRLRLPKRERKLGKRLERAVALAEQVLARTSTADLPWHVVDGRHERRRDVTVARTILSVLARRLAAAAPAPPMPPGITSSPDAPPTTVVVADEAPPPDVARPAALDPAAAADGAPPEPGTLAGIDLGAHVGERVYERRKSALQRDLRALSQRAHAERVATIVVLEGWDAAGKGGAIRRLIAPIDVHDVQVVPIGAPSPRERARHYLWRFWTRVPRDGEVVVFDRSWYGRVLVERVEGLCPEPAWRRAYAEIRAFEEQLTAHGIVLCKLWLHISADEQWRRFQAREQTPFKRYKITPADYRNREHRDAYVAAVDEMLRRTHVTSAPWTLVAAEDKRHARLVVLETVRDALARRLGPADGD